MVAQQLRYVLGCTEMIKSYKYHAVSCVQSDDRSKDTTSYQKVNSRDKTLLPTLAPKLT